MSSVKIECETSATSYTLYIYKYRDTHIKTCPQNNPYEGELDDGEYLVTWKIFGEENTKYTIKFTGVSSPKNPVKRKIRQGYWSSFDQQKFTVGGQEDDS